MKQKKKYSRTIFKQLVFFTVVISVFPIGIISVILFGKIEAMAEKELMESYRQLASQYTGMISEKFAQYEKSVQYISKNRTVMDQLQNSGLSMYQRGVMISEEVIKSLILEGQSEIRSCMVYSERMESPVYGTRVSTMHAARSEGWYSYYPGITGQWFFYPEYSGGTETIASVVYGIEKVHLDSFGQEELGIVKLDLYFRRIFSPANTSGQGGFDVIVYDDAGTIWYSTDQKNNEKLEQYQGWETADGKTDQGGIGQAADQVVSISKIGGCGLHVLMLFGNHELTEKQREVKGLIIPVILTVVLAVTMASYLFAQRFSKRVNLLVEKFKMAETGNLAITEPVSGSDEIVILDQQFSHMLKKLDQLIQKNYVQELERKETELKNLRLQINPHFLYNTLETISSIAAVRQVFVVCDICEKLGEIFRYSLGKDYGEFVTVEQELHHVQNYIFIQKLRYGNKFEVFYNVEPETEYCLLPRFILQPIVENAILHGIGPMTGAGTLEITAEEQRDGLVVKIEDDGVGMPEEQRKKLETSINRTGQEGEDKKSIGVRNVNRRIKLICGEEYGVVIESRPYQGSCFTMTFPLRRKGKDGGNDV